MAERKAVQPIDSLPVAAIRPNFLDWAKQAERSLVPIQKEYLAKFRALSKMRQDILLHNTKITDSIRFIAIDRAYEEQQREDAAKHTEAPTETIFEDTTKPTIT